MQTTTTDGVLTARRSSLACAFWGRYFEWTVRRSFSRVLISGDHVLRPWSTGQAEGPAILFSTHGSWWDAAMAMVISLRTHSLPAYGMMEYRQLVKYQFFRSIGLFSVVRENPRSALSSIDYGASLLRNTSNVLWMFPQGTLVHQDKRPLQLDPGLAILCRSLQGATIIPVAMRYDLLLEQRPEARIGIGDPLYISPAMANDLRATISIAQQLLSACADNIQRDAYAAEQAGYRTLYQGCLSMEKRYDIIKKRLGFTTDPN
jgi:chlorobactene lauroyltransferase